MHVKAQREPARHFVVLDCRLVPLHNTCQSLHAVLSCGKVAVCPNAKI